MNNEEITSLAREYAEEMHYGDNYFEAENKRLLEWLLRRYCLVEKEAVREEYDLAKGIYAKATCETAKDFNMGRMSAIESLFSDLGKEVES